MLSKLRLLFSYIIGHKRQVTAAVIEKDGKILIAKRRLGRTLGGKWEFPGIFWLYNWTGRAKYILKSITKRNFIHEPI